MRLLSVKAEAASTHQQKALDPSKLSITKTTKAKTLSKPEDLVFGREFTGKDIPSGSNYQYFFC